MTPSPLRCQPYQSLLRALLLIAHLQLFASEPSPPHTTATESTSSTFNVVGYMPEYRFGWELDRWEQACRHLTHLILFSLEVEHDGTLAALDRFPSKELMPIIQSAAKKHKTKILICFGGNSRSRGFATVVKSEKLRKEFVSNLKLFLEQNQLDGVDYNWEYPANGAEWKGLSSLAKETKAAVGQEGVVTMAYYPDTRHEQIIKHFRLHEHVDLLHSMSYDQRGKHSTLKLAQQTVKQWVQNGLPRSKLCLGVPFYARHIETGEAKTYEEIHRTHKPLRPKQNGVGKYYFNGVSMIQKKVKYAQQKWHLGGIMIWEIGQDISPTSEESLLRAITSVVHDGDSDENDSENKYNGRDEL